MNHVLVLGLGNTLQTDEGIGVHVIHHLQKTSTFINTSYVDGGTHSFQLSNLIEDTSHLIVVDTAELQSSPGSIGVFQQQAMDEFVAHGAKSSAHEIGLKDVLSMALLQGRLPERRALVAIQPSQFGWGEQPSQILSAVIPQAAKQVMNIIRSWH